MINVNYMLQRRVLVTPTMTLFFPQVMDETHMVLRNLPDKKSYFFRLSIVNDYHEKNYYNN